MDIVRHKIEVGSRLRMAIEALGLSQTAAGRPFGVTAQKMGNWLRGDHYPDPWFIFNFCARHPITADWIYLGRASGLTGEMGDALFAGASASQAAQLEVEHQAQQTPAVGLP